MNKLPLNWCECKFGDVCYLQNGYAFNSKEYSDSGVNLIRISDIQKDKVITDNCVKVCDNVDSCFRVNKGDFLLAMSGATTGKTGIYLYDNYALLNQRVGNLKIYSENVLNPLYRNYFIMNKRREIEKKAYGGAQPNISKQLIEDLDLLLPPLAEQGRIVEKIEKMFEKIDAGVEKLKSAQEKIKQYKQSVLHSAFTGKLYKTTEWKNAELKDVCKKITDGSHNPPGKQYSGIPMLSGQNIKNNRINFDDFRFISEKDYEFELKRTPIESGDILLTIVGTIGQSAVVPEQISPFAIQRSVALIKPAKDILSLFIKYYFDSPIAKSFFKIKERGTAQKGIYLNTLKELIITIPTIPEQKKIVEEIEKRFTKADKMLDAVEKSLQLSEQLKQSVLKKAFEGKLVPQDPNDEPASVLLDRIKSEKQQNEKAKGKKK